VTTTATIADCTAHNSVDGSEAHTGTTFSTFTDFLTNITVTAGYDKIASQTSSGPKETGSGSDDGEDGGDNADGGDDKDGAAVGLLPGAIVASAAALVGALMML
jgi:hypothetical protein